MKVNSFQGNIPSSLSSLKGLQELDLSHNNLSGQIPIYLEEFLFLQYLNVSFNDLEGAVPVHRIFQNASALSIQGNRKLCGGITKLGLPPCSKLAPKKHKKALPLIGIVISSVVAVLSLFLLSYFLAHYKLKKSGKKSPIISSMGERFLEVTYAELLKATDGFSSANLIGVGSFGFVYKGILDQIGLTAAIKVLKLQQHRAPKSFVAECKALRSIRHRNVVKILSVCSSIDFTGNDFKALVFEYMPNGSLDTWLHPNEEKHNSTGLNFIQRLNVAIDVASALDYLHHDCEASVVHCDLKPSNILLDEDMVAHVGDFGLARIFSKDVSNCPQTQSSSIGIKGSIGYVTPEYGMGGEVSTYGDMYSYGILLLEMFTGKRPTDDVFKDNLNLHQLAKMAFPERVIEIIDHHLLLEGNENISSNEDYNEKRSRMHECLLSLVRIGISCSIEAQRERSEMREVMLELQRVRDFYLGVNNFNLGELIPQPRIVKKILRSLLERFRPKVVVIKDYQDLNSLTVEELVGNLQTYAANHCQTKRGKDIALVSSNSMDDNENSDSSYDYEDAKFEAYFAKNFKKMWKNRKSITKKDSHNPKATTKGKFAQEIEKNQDKGTSKPIQCFECQGYGNTTAKCHDSGPRSDNPEP
ncbi:LRR.XII-like protein [Cinnamomum micranthum f. kanehirae]|uniref:non-specific serine/threonine protein kinase n=1 Tax=Cinnamomum micranthum f. kanehirae TaxID=337451 RepID=A0A443PKD0_9MAGN|nr:LRR.XII-like protein [Cinnamomum micranthum f. kanehirae]